MHGIYGKGGKKRGGWKEGSERKRTLAADMQPSATKTTKSFINKLLTLLSY